MDLYLPRHIKAALIDNDQQVQLDFGFKLFDLDEDVVSGSCMADLSPHAYKNHS